MDTLSALIAEPSGLTVTDETGTLDWAGFTARVQAVAAQLRYAGVAAEDRVALWLPNSADYLAAIFACARLGAAAIHINTRFGSGEVGDLLRRAKPRALITQWDFAPVDFPAILAGLAEEDRASLRAVLGRNQPRGVESLAGLPVLPLTWDGGTVPDAAHPDLPCLTYTTSGTTSGPKLVLHHQRSIASHAREVMRHLGLDQEGAVYLAAVPFCGTFGNAAVMAAIAGGAAILSMERFDAVKAAALIRNRAVTHAVGGDDMLARLIEAADGRPYTSMRFFGFAAFHASAARTALAADAIGLAPAGVYGSSEVQALFSIAEGETRLLGGGRPVNAAAELSIRDPETGAVLPPGESGEICFRAPSRFVGYLDNDAATAKAATADGFFRSGDLGRLGGGGFIYEARLGDTLRLGGFLVNPEEIEGFLLDLPGVAGVQVVAALHDGDPVPVAFVLPAPGAALDEAVLLDACRGKLARFKLPKRIAMVDAFPFTDSPNGPKIQRVRLREMAAALLAPNTGLG
jgi:fatty-acyl-CoA synthase